MSSESRIWEIRLFGSMRGGSALVIGLWPFNPTAPAYSTLWKRTLLHHWSSHRLLTDQSTCEFFSLAPSDGEGWGEGQCTLAPSVSEKEREGEPYPEIGRAGVHRH